MEFCNLLQKVTEDFLGNYVNIDGIEELFHSSYFYFEWMMHLEYKEREHSYSYYRDHYLHQIRNLYEMFIFLDKLDMWRNCMDLYKGKNNATANRIHESIVEQITFMPSKEKRLLKSIKTKDQSQTSLEEFCYHYLFLAVAIEQKMKFPNPKKKMAVGKVYMEGEPQDTNAKERHVCWWLFENVDISGFKIGEEGE